MIIRAIREAAIAHAAKFGKPANAVYLGQAEIDSLEHDLAYSEAFKRYGNCKPAVNGLRIFRVAETSHLTVCNTPEAER
jgi:virulence-associated protein VapD